MRKIANSSSIACVDELYRENVLLVVLSCSAFTVLSAPQTVGAGRQKSCPWREVLCVCGWGRGNPPNPFGESPQNMVLVKSPQNRVGPSREALVEGGRDGTPKQWSTSAFSILS